MGQSNIVFVERVRIWLYSHETGGRTLINHLILMSQAHFELLEQEGTNDLVIDSQYYTFWQVLMLSYAISGTRIRKLECVRTFNLYFVQWLKKKINCFVFDDLLLYQVCKKPSHCSTVHLSVSTQSSDSWNWNWNAMPNWFFSNNGSCGLHEWAFDSSFLTIGP